MATSNTAAQFKLDLADALKDEVEDVVVMVTQKVALEALNRIVMRSPVDTGRFRANWNVSFGTEDLSTTDATDKSGSSTIAKGLATINQYAKLSQVIYVSNNLPYANRLENGWSKQAPQGMVALTLAELSTIGKIE